MTTARALIQQAYREGNIIPVGATPSTPELTEALPRLNRYIRGVFGFEMGELMADWVHPQPQRTGNHANFPQAPFSNDLGSGVTPYPPKNSRIVWGGIADSTLYFPEAPDNGSRMGLVIGTKADTTKVLTLSGNGRMIEGAAVQAQPTPPIVKEWLYRADLGDWKLVADMTIDQECPFPIEHDDLWICLLAIRLASRYGKVTTSETMAIAKVALQRFQTAYRQTQDTVYRSYDHPLALQSFSGAWWW